MLNNTIFNLYIDESGNTGANILDSKQPYFIYSGWIVQNGLEHRIMNNIKSKNLLPKTNAVELKSKNYFKNNNKDKNKKEKKYDSIYKGFKDLFVELLSNKAIPYVEIVDKKFIMICHIVTTFFRFDIKLNYYRRIMKCYDFNELKKVQDDIVNIIYDNFDNDCLINRFWDEIRKDEQIFSNKSVLNDIQDYLCNIFDNTKLHALYNFVKNKDTDNIENTIKTKSFIGDMLLRLLMRINDDIRTSNINVNIFHDNRQDIQEIFNHVNIYKNNLEYINFPLNNLDSKSAHFIQFSDLLCGFFRMQMANIYDNESINKYAKDTIFEYFIDKKKNENKGFVLFTSYKNDCDFLSKLGINITEEKYYIDKIEKIFNKYYCKL